MASFTFDSFPFQQTATTLNPLRGFGPAAAGTGSAFEVDCQAPAGTKKSCAIVGTNDSATPGASTVGVMGSAQAGVGVVGVSSSGTGVDAASGSGPALAANSMGGVGILASSQFGSGVNASSAGAANTSGVWGNHTGAGNGLSGHSVSGNGVVASSQSGTGVSSVSGTGTGVYGESQAGDGVHGLSHSEGSGVAGVNDNPHGGTGVYGESHAFDGVHGLSHSSNSGVAGVNDNPNGGTGVYGTGHVGGSFTAVSNPKNDGNGLQVNDSNNEDALVSNSGSANHAAVAGHNSNGGFAFWGASDSAGGFGIYARGQKQAAQFDGHVQVNGDHSTTGTMTVGVDLVLTNADCAEDFDIAASARIEPGTVMALDDGGSLRPSDQSYDKKVVGVISGAGELRPGMILDRHESVEKRAPLALMGKVCCKVDAQYGSIEVGDLLTTSSTPGHAMKATDPARAFGAVIGKALRPLAEGEGLIPVLVALQ